MSLKKRLRVLWAALTQRWHEHQCRTCHDTWFCQGTNCELYPGEECGACADAGYSEWARRHGEVA